MTSDSYAALISHFIKSSENTNGWLIDGYPMSIENASSLINLDILPNFIYFVKAGST